MPRGTMWSTTKPTVMDMDKYLCTLRVGLQTNTATTTSSAALAHSSWSRETSTHSGTSSSKSCSLRSLKLSRGSGRELTPLQRRPKTKGPALRGASLGHHQTGIIYLPHHVKFEATKRPVGTIQPGVRRPLSDSWASETP
jgi:hypothetical protein